MTTVTVVDYGSGNVFSVRRALEFHGADVRFAETPAAVREAERLVLPGVGAFGACRALLGQRGLDDAVRSFAGTGRPFLGICVGMQMLFDSSDEFGVHDGLGLMAGRVAAIPDRTSDGRILKRPHIGWSPLDADAPWADTPLRDVGLGSAVYFVHSFHCVPDDSALRLASVAYGGHRLCAAVRDGVVFGCQFHPEKSGPVGLGMIKGFLSL